jgi:very-short-patch-repair endonuclease
MYKDREQREFARALRHNMTAAEKRLWLFLKSKQFHGYKFRRQAAIGAYIVDFVCFQAKLIIELDGGQHNEESHKQYDDQRTIWLEAEGFKVLRFWNHDVFENIEGIAEVIWRAFQDEVAELAPSPTLPTRGRE